jgi:hypothetical protein
MKKVLGFSAASLVLLVGIAIAADPPEVKEGLWSIHRQTTNNPGNKTTDSTSTICRNHAYDQHVQSLAKNMKGCTTVSESLQSGRYSIQTHCLIGTTVVDSKGTTTYEADTSAHSESHTTFTPPMAGMSDTIMVMDQKYEGSCPAGAQPGDMTSADGRVTHLWKH